MQTEANGLPFVIPYGSDGQQCPEQQMNASGLIMHLKVGFPSGIGYEQRRWFRTPTTAAPGNNSEKYWLVYSFLAKTEAITARAVSG
jgi:hypothetical protein